MRCNGRCSRNIGEIPFLWRVITFVTSPCRNRSDCRSSTSSVRKHTALKNSPDYGSAGKDLGTLCAARYSSYSGGVSVSEKNALEVIEQERVKELYMEGFRLQDLKRWHKGFERKPQSESLDNGSSLKVEKDDPRFVWPIPQNELDAPGSDIQPNESNK